MQGPSGHVVPWSVGITPTMDCAPYATPRSQSATGGVSDAEEGRFPWEPLLFRAIHPIKVALIEAMLWIELPLSASDVARMFDEEAYDYDVSLISHHAKVLADQGVLALVDTQPVRGAIKHNFVLAPPSRWR